MNWSQDLNSSVTLNYTAPQCAQDTWMGPLKWCHWQTSPTSVCQQAEQYWVPETTLDCSMATQFSRLEWGKVESPPPTSLGLCNEYKALGKQNKHSPFLKQLWSLGPGRNKLSRTMIMKNPISSAMGMAQALIIAKLLLQKKYLTTSNVCDLPFCRVNTWHPSRLESYSEILKVCLWAINPPSNCKEQFQSYGDCHKPWAFPPQQPSRSNDQKPLRLLWSKGPSVGSTLVFWLERVKDEESH